MPIDLKSIIADSSAIKSGGFSGAVFLTYTLNLGFFEQIIATSLETAGCSNVLIIADPDGYAEAIQMGLKNVAHAGQHYVCTPLPRKGQGVQHIKLLFMAGPERGRLLTGSGNLTMHGYSRNLEIYSHFEYDPHAPDPEAKYALHTVWKRLQDIAAEETFSTTAHRQIEGIAENALWLKEEPDNPSDFAIWDNYDFPLWEQLTQWRQKAGLVDKNVRTLRVFSPYYDQDGSMLRQFTETLSPGRLEIYLSRENTTLDGHQLHTNWPDGSDFPEAFDIKESEENKSQRLLHAKIVVGIEENGSWCISGSANMTRAAFAKSWQLGSNLESVTFRWSPDPEAFDYLLEKPAILTPLDLDSLEAPAISAHSEQPRIVFADSILLTELTLQDNILSGKVIHWPAEESRTAKLEFLRSRESLTIQLDQADRFLVPYAKVLQTSEAALLRGAACESLPRWIDVPALLQNYGARSYRERIQTSLDTIAGAESLFHELLEFLFDRVTPDSAAETGSRQTRRHHTRNEPQDSPQDDSPVPEAERFIVPERDATGRFLLEGYAQHPYDRNIYSLRDLLSIVLLKLSEPPDISPERYDNEIEDEPTEQEDLAEKEEQEQSNARQRLCNYLISYCKRYSRRICQSDFLENIPPAVLLDNHLTLCRVLMEFQTCIPEFRPQDFASCYWGVWAPLIWPSIPGNQEKSCWQFYLDHDQQKEFLITWDSLDLTGLFAVMTGAAFNPPPSWPLGLHDTQLVRKYLTIQEMTERFKNQLRISEWKVAGSNQSGISRIEQEVCLLTFQRITAYQPPAQERLRPIFAWIENNYTLTADIELCIQKNGLQAEFEGFQKNRKEILAIYLKADLEGEIYCPKCNGALNQQSISKLERGKLVLCSVSKGAWLYKSEKEFTQMHP